MTVTYRTSGTWGPGKGSNLTPAEVDENFWQLVQDVATKAATGAGIANFYVTGDQMTVVLTDHTLLGPYTLPTAKIVFVGAWSPATIYYVNDILTANGSTYIVLLNHTSAGSFSPSANNGHGSDYYGLLLDNPNNALPSGGAANQVLAKATSSDYATAWAWQNLATLHDVLQSPGPSSGDLITYNGSHFTYVTRATVVGANPDLRNLSDVLASPAPTTGDLITWTGSAFTYVDRATVRGATVVPNLVDLTDVLHSPHPSTNQIIYWNGAQFTYKTPTSAMLTDYDYGYYTALEPGDFTVYDPSLSQWVNRQPTTYLAWATISDTLAYPFQNALADAIGGAPQTVTIPTNATTAFPNGAIFWFRQADGGNQITATPAGGVTLNKPAGRLAQSRAVGSIFCLQQISTDDWNISGDLAFDPAANIFNTTGTTNLDARLSDCDFVLLTPTGNCTLTAVASSPTFGKRLTLVITTSGSTSYTIAFSTRFKANGSLATGTTTGRVLTISFVGDGTNFNETARSAGYSTTATSTTGTYSLDPTLGDSNIYTATPTGALTINATAAPIQKQITFVVTTSGVSSFNITFGTNFKSTGVLATGTVTAKVFTVNFVGDGTNFNEISRTTAM